MLISTLFPLLGVAHTLVSQGLQKEDTLVSGGLKKIQNRLPSKYVYKAPKNVGTWCGGDFDLLRRYEEGRLVTNRKENVKIHRESENDTQHR